VFGPSPTVVEMFAYLGAGFLLGAWSAFVSKLAVGGTSLSLVGGGLLAAAIVLAAAALVLRRGDDRRRRGAGMAFLTAILFAAASEAGFLSDLRLGGSAEALIVALVAFGVAGVFRRLHASLLTHLGVLTSATAVGGFFLAWLRDLVAPANFDDNGQPIGAMPDPIVMIVVSAAIWLLLALALGVLALRERTDRSERTGSRGAAHRRAALTQAWAGTVAVGGLASALNRNDLLSSGEFGRVITPWITDLAILALAIILVERAFRRDSGAFLFAAGLGLLTALTDFNFSYLSQSTDVGLLIEGAILLALGFGGDRLRRRLDRARHRPTYVVPDGGEGPGVAPA
jgi:hypothetical protein